jgi:hypothetical protein
MSESRTRAATMGEESNQRKPTRFSIPSAEANHVSPTNDGRVFSRDGKSARLVTSTVFSLSNERCSRASTVSPARVIDRLEANARRAVRAFFFLGIT